MPKVGSTSAKQVHPFFNCVACEDTQVNRKGEPCPICVVWDTGLPLGTDETEKDQNLFPVAQIDQNQSTPQMDDSPHESSPNPVGMNLATPNGESSSPAKTVQGLPNNVMPSLKGMVVPLDSLTPDPENARLHPERNMKAIEDSLNRYGQRKPIVVRQQNMMIAAGNGTWQAAKNLGWTEIAASIEPMTDEVFRGYALSDNRTAELAQWDHDMLAKLHGILEKVNAVPDGWTPEEIQVARRFDWHQPEEEESEEHVPYRGRALHGRDVPVDYAKSVDFTSDQWEKIEEALESIKDGSDNDGEREHGDLLPRLIAKVCELASENKSLMHVAGSGTDEWYTPSIYIEMSREVLGAIDLDPASCELAQKTVKAAKFYTSETDGLSAEWSGKVWMNPPYGVNLVHKFVNKICDCIESKSVTEAIVVVNSSTDAKWFQRALSLSSVICLVSGRIKWIDSETSEPCKGGGPIAGSTFFYFGDDPGTFISVFSSIGTCLTVVNNNVAT